METITYASGSLFLLSLILVKRKISSAKSHFSHWKKRKRLEIFVSDNLQTFKLELLAFGYYACSITLDQFLNHPHYVWKLQKMSHFYHSSWDIWVWSKSEKCFHKRHLVIFGKFWRIYIFCQRLYFSCQMRDEMRDFFFCAFVSRSYSNAC